MKRGGDKAGDKPGPKAKTKGSKTKGSGKGGKGRDKPDVAAPVQAPRRPLVGPYVALPGLVGVAVIAVMMLRGQLDLVSAGGRAGVLLVALLAVEHVLLPVCRALVGSPDPARRPTP